MPDQLVGGVLEDRWTVPASSGQADYSVCLARCHCTCQDWLYGAPFIGATSGYEKATMKICKHVLACIFIACWQATDGHIDSTGQLDPIFSQAVRSEEQRLELVVRTSVRSAFNAKGNRVGLANREVVTKYRILRS